MKKKISWKDILGKEKKLPYFRKIMSYIFKCRRKGIIIYPADKEIFNAFRFTDLHSVKVVILGQDPYHGICQANGLAFSVNYNICSIPPSLRNIYFELSRDVNDFTIPNHGELSSWAKQGVLLLNTVLTVELKKPGSHFGLGWEIFTDKVIQSINFFRKGIVFLLWGNNARKKMKLIDPNRHHILLSSHPSPLSVNKGFFGCRHFSMANSLLQKEGMKTIEWNSVSNFIKKEKI